MASSSLLLSSATASMVGLSLPTPAPTRLSASARVPSVSIRSMAPVASQQQQPDSPHLLAEERDMRRRGIMFGAIASALTLVSNVAHAEEKKKKKCPTICVSNPTASCCFGG